jgi:hypothetical protein
VGALQPKDEYKPSQAEINEGNRKLLSVLSERLRVYAGHEHIDKIKIKYGESKPLKPVFMDGCEKAVGFIEQGPRILSLVIEDFTHDGKLRAADLSDADK